MKKYHSVALAGVCAGALCVTTYAQTPVINNTTTSTTTTTTTTTTSGLNYYSFTPRAYIGVDVGGVLTSDLKVNEWFGSSVSPNTRVKLDPGFRVEFHGGYQLTDWFSVEGETGFMGNRIESVTGGTVSGYAAVDNIPLLANVRFQLPPQKFPVTPYIGGGAGGSISILDISDNINVGGDSEGGADATLVFAYQAFGGLRWAINDNMGIGVAYHYFVTTGSDWAFNPLGLFPNDHTKFSGGRSHAISLTFDYHF